jgi:hypothetical protein
MREIIVIEAKKGDIDKGFNQLIAELIAMDKFISPTMTMNRWNGCVKIA